MRPAHATGSCLSVSSGSTTDGGNIDQGACSGNNSHWRFEPRPDGSLRMVARHSGKVLDVSSCGLADNTDIAQWSWLDNNCQRFRFMPV